MILQNYVEDIRTLAYKHIIKADDIIEKPVSYPDRKYMVLIYDIRGNTASSLSFYLTDSSRNFLKRGLVFQCDTQQRFPGTGHPVFFSRILNT